MLSNLLFSVRFDPVLVSHFAFVAAYRLVANPRRHLAVLTCAAICAMSSIAPNWHPWSATSYRTALAAAVIAYGVIIHGARGVRKLHVFWSIAVLNLGN